MVIPKVAYATLELESPFRKGTFDGVTRKVQFEGGVSNAAWVSVTTMTLRPSLYTTAGELAYEGAGGLDFAQKSVRDGHQVRQVSKETADFDYAEIQEGVALSLAPLVDATRPLAPKPN